MNEATSIVQCEALLIQFTESGTSAQIQFLLPPDLVGVQSTNKNTNNQLSETNSFCVPSSMESSALVENWLPFDVKMNPWCCIGCRVKVSICIIHGGNEELPQMSTYIAGSFSRKSSTKQQKRRRCSFSLISCCCHPIVSGKTTSVLSNRGETETNFVSSLVLDGRIIRVTENRWLMDQYSGQMVGLSPPLPTFFIKPLSLSCSGGDVNLAVMTLSQLISSSTALDCVAAVGSLVQFTMVQGTLLVSQARLVSIEELYSKKELWVDSCCSIAQPGADAGGVVRGVVPKTVAALDATSDTIIRVKVEALDDDRSCYTPLVYQVQGVVGEESSSSVEVGSWLASGMIPSYFFHPDLEIRCIYDGAELKNTIPPLVRQGSCILLELWAFWILQGTVLQLTIRNEEGIDVTAMVATGGGEGVSPFWNPNARVVTLDDMNPQKLVQFNIQIATFPIDDGCSEFSIEIEARRPRTRDGGGCTTTVSSRSVFIRSAASLVEEPQRFAEQSLSFKYWSTDVLTPFDKLKEGFVDCGRSNELALSVFYRPEHVQRSREILVIDKCDDTLQNLVATAKAFTGTIMHTESRSMALAYLVSSQFGGSKVTDLSFEQELLEVRAALDTRKRRRSSAAPKQVLSKSLEATVKLGALSVGLCRHRALLFKYLSDRCKIPCYLVRGLHGPTAHDAERHSWNVVVVCNKQLALMDTSMHPISLQPWPSPLYHCITPLIRPVSSTQSADTESSSSSSNRWAEFGFFHQSRFDQLIRCEDLGRGSTSIVQRVILGGFTCALKGPRTPQDVPLLLREMEILQHFKMTDPTDRNHIVQCLGWRRGILLEYFPFSLLGLMNQLILRQKRMSENQIRAVLRAVCHALLVMHRKKFVHRDVKAENVLVLALRCDNCLQLGIVCGDCQLQVKLCDVADAYEFPDEGPCISIQCAKVGTVPYAAPEIDAESTFSTAADMWSFGILALEMSMMKLPIPRNSSGIKMPSPYCSKKTVFVPTVPRSDTVKGAVVSPWLTELMERCLKVEWRERITAQEALQLVLKCSKDVSSPLKEKNM